MPYEPGIFREYDIRGRVPQELNPEIVEKIGKAFATYVIEQGFQGKDMVVARDNRLSSEELKNALVRGLSFCGEQVTDIGEATTPMLYWAVIAEKAKGGVMVTGSHNPPEWNGLKLTKDYREHALNIYGSEIQELRKKVESGNFKKGAARPEDYLIRKNIEDSYVQDIIRRISIKRKLRIVIEAGNGTAGPFAVKVLERLGCKVRKLHCQSDGTFPYHLPDPTKLSYLQGLMREVKNFQADVGLAFDGDGDRLGVIDDQGNVVWGDRLLAFFSRFVLEKHPGAKIVFEVLSSQALIDEIERLGGRPIMWKVGHSLVKNKMKEEGALLGGEISAHLFLADEWYGFEDGSYAAARLIEILSRTDRKLSDLLSDIPQYLATPELRVTLAADCQEKEKWNIVEAIKEHFRAQGYKIIEIDGARIVFENGWAVIRASNTEPKLTLRFEAFTNEEDLAEIKESVKAKLREFPLNQQELEF